MIVRTSAVGVAPPARTTFLPRRTAARLGLKVMVTIPVRPGRPCNFPKERVDTPASLSAPDTVIEALAGGDAAATSPAAALKSDQTRAVQIRFIVIPPCP